MDRESKSIEVPCPAGIRRKCVGSRMFKIGRDDTNERTYLPEKESLAVNIEKFCMDIWRVVKNKMRL